jgi:hypothetical protein
MACGCVPIVSKVASMPFIVGSWGLIIEKRDPALLVQKVLSFIDSSLPSPEVVSQDILQRFPLHRRKTELLDLLKNLTSHSKTKTHGSH